ncbi:MAG: D-tyrosyl-tRNA(Tyr) deacylase [Clostridia bacterium]|nr:D-tyrosyl-tRNA(Tyr) deacylase [Clostridia bacterium]
MVFVIQRVTSASVKVDGKTVGGIERGLAVLCGIFDDDTEQTAAKMVKKLCALRIFEDENGKTNLSAADVGGRLLIISQFTLCADCTHGNRPAFVAAARPEKAEPLYRYILGEAEKYLPGAEHGIFGADMKVEIHNDGPFTVILDSRELGY